MGNIVYGFGELDEILKDANEKVDDDVAGPLPIGEPTSCGCDDDCDGTTCSKDCDCGACPTSDDRMSMTPDPKPDNYYGGGSMTASPVGPALPNPQMTLLLEKIRIGLSTHVSPSVLDQMKFDQKYDPITDKIIAEIGMYLFSNKIHTETTKEEIFSSWWDGFKASFFPGWLERKFPVKRNQIFKEIKTIHICPHLNYRTREEERFHLQFLIPEGELTRVQG